ncbi:MAG: hypothetical protein ACXACD_16560, partial [Candidatus Thorarchaeota archaeon]
MNEFRTYPSTTRFDPPEEGLMPGESIVWTRRAGIGFWTIFVGFIVVILGPVLVVFGIEDIGFYATLPLLLIVAAGIIGLIAKLIRTKR